MIQAKSRSRTLRCPSCKCKWQKRNVTSRRVFTHHSLWLNKTRAKWRQIYCLAINTITEHNNYEHWNHKQFWTLIITILITQWFDKTTKLKSHNDLVGWNSKCPVNMCNIQELPSLGNTTILAKARAGWEGAKSSWQNSQRPRNAGCSIHKHCTKRSNSSYSSGPV